MVSNPGLMFKARALRYVFSLRTTPSPASLEVWTALLFYGGGVRFFRVPGRPC
jgi:hypothetical protein